MTLRVFKEMIGQTMIQASQSGDEMVLVDTAGNRYTFAHEQDCCERVAIEDVCGDMDDLVGSPIVMAEEVGSDGRDLPERPEWDESSTWTFYRFGTAKGSVTVRWLGTSNGYYSESVDYTFSKAGTPFNA